MLFPDVELDAADFDQAGWEQVLEQTQEKQCAYYSNVLYRSAREARERNDVKGEAVFALLGAVASLHLRSEERSQPYVAAMALGTSRTAVLDDFSEVQLDILRELVSRTADSEMKARLADILWERRRDRVMAESAINSYLDAAMLLEHPYEWPPCFERIERAIRIAARLGLSGAYFKRVVSYIDELLNKYQGTDSSYLTARLMELLIEHRQGRPITLARYARVAATNAERAGDWRRARKYLSLLAEWQAQAGHQKAADQSRRASAETYVKEAQLALKTPKQGALAATVHLQSAIQAMRRLSGTRRRIAELNKLLLKSGQDSIGEMKHATSSADASPMIEHTILSVKDKPFRDALFSLITLINPPKLSTLREFVNNVTEKYPMQYIFSRSIVDGQGRLQATVPPLFTSDERSREAAIEAYMFSHAKLYRNTSVTGVIIPAIQQITSEHRAGLQDFYDLVENNPFVPPGREMIFAHGLHAGIHGDFLKSSHLLVPQIENSLRYILGQYGVETSVPDRFGIQHLMDLNKMLNEMQDDLAKAFTRNMIFELRGLLVSAFGDNLRNEIAHGRVGHAEFNSTSSIYLWWLALRLCCEPLFVDRVSADAEEADANVSE